MWSGTWEANPGKNCEYVSVFKRFDIVLESPDTLCTWCALVWFLGQIEFSFSSSTSTPRWRQLIELPSSSDSFSKRLAVAFSVGLFPCQVVFRYFHARKAETQEHTDAQGQHSRQLYNHQKTPAFSNFCVICLYILLTVVSQKYESTFHNTASISRSFQHNRNQIFNGIFQHAVLNSGTLIHVLFLSNEILNTVL